MLLGRVVGNVWATRKDETLDGVRLLLVRPFTAAGRDPPETRGADDPTGDEAPDIVVAADPIGAGMGETVLVAFGRAARNVLGSQDIAWQAAVVGIVDGISLQEGGTFELSDDGERVPR